MLPSEELRKDIAKKYNVDLEKYAWPKKAIPYYKLL